MLQAFIDAFVILFVVIDPIGLAPIFGGITHGGGIAYKRSMAVRGTVIAAIILVLFVLVGGRLLVALGISMPAFQIAGGALLFLLAVDMVFARQSGLRSTTEREQKEAEQKKDVSVFPLAFPLIAGPGALTTVLLMVGQRGSDPKALGIVLSVVILVLALTLLSLLLSMRIIRLMGETGANVVSRVLGVILAALAVQYVLDGVVAGFY